MIGTKVTIDNGGTYQGRAVEVLAVEPAGSLIVRHPKGSGRMRLQPARTNSHGVRIEAQFRTV
jgi:hypothetical protein